MVSSARNVNLSTSPSRSYSASVPRSESIARLASPVPHRASTPLSESGSGSGSGSLTPLAGTPTVGTAKYVGPGTSALAAALNSSVGTSPSRLGTPAVRPLSPANQAVATATATAWASGSALLGTTPPAFTYGSFESRSRGGFEDPEIVKRHLVQPAFENDPQAEPLAAKGKASDKKTTTTTTTVEPDAGDFTSLRLQGGDITRGIYRWAEDAAKAPRRNSFALLRPEPENETLDIASIKTPGGFRRNYLRRAAGTSTPPPLDSSSHADRCHSSEYYADHHHHPHHHHHNHHNHPPRLPTSSFLEFLSLYGHFAGEELEEDDEVLGPDEYFSDAASRSDESSGDDEREPMEDSVLLTPSRRRRRRKPRGGSGNNSPVNAALLLLKSFVGTGVLFLPRAYLNGGMLFGTLVLLALAALSYYCFVLLVSVRLRLNGSFGDLGGILYGNWMRTMILSSIVLSQVGFVAAYTVFTAENLRAFVLAVTRCETVIDVKWFILLQMVVFLPFSLLRDIGKLGFTALVADAFILIGLAYLLYYDVFTLTSTGLADIVYFNRDDWTLFIGTAIFTFEGIGLILPIQESMRHPQKFPAVLFAVMVIITVLFITMGLVSYAAYGSATETVVLLNLPQDDKLVNAVQFLYSVAILLSTPLQIFPAVKITENALFAKSGKYNPYIKWQKNVYRFFVVACCMAIAWGGAANLDKFVALVGNFACIPLVFIYPPLLHYRAVARTTIRRVMDVALTIFGFLAMGYASTLTIMSWASTPSPPPPLPGFCSHGGN